MLNIPRSSGILASPASLPGRFGMGEIGQEAHRWLEMLRTMGQRVWLMPPLGPLDAARTPGSLASAFAGDPLLVSFESLRNDGALLPQDLAMIPAFRADHIETGPVREVRMAFLKLAARRFLAQCDSSPLLRRAFDYFCENEAAAWLDDHAMYAVLSEKHGPARESWPEGLARRERAALDEAKAALAMEIEEQRALQFFFHRQWIRLRAKAKELGIHLAMDLPLPVPAASADAWAGQSLFEAGQPGHAPVMTTARWREHEDSGFAWWRSRARKMLGWVDALRLTGASAVPAAEFEKLATALRGELGAHVPLLVDESATDPTLAAAAARHGIAPTHVLPAAPEMAGSVTEHSLALGIGRLGGMESKEAIASLLRAKSRLAITAIPSLVSLAPGATLQVPEDAPWTWRFEWDHLPADTLGFMLRLARETERF